MRETILILLMLAVSIGYTQEQDKVYLKNKEVVIGKILKVDKENIEIDPEGDKPFLIIKRADADIIIYSDNTVVNLEDLPTKVTDTRKELSKSLVNGFRTDGYYINKQGIEYRYKKREILMGTMVNSSKHILFIGFRVDSRTNQESKEYTEVQAAIFIERKRDLKKTLEQESNPSWQEFHEEHLSKDKIERVFIENEIRKEEDEIVAVQMNFKKDPFTLINYKDGITVMMGNFFGVKQGVPRVDFLICRDAMTFKHPRYGKWTGEDVYDPKMTFSESPNKFWELHKNVELEFFPDESE